MAWDRDPSPILVPSRRPTGPGWEQIFFHGMGWDQIYVGWELPVPSQLYARTGMGQDLDGMGAPIPVPRPAYLVIEFNNSNFELKINNYLINEIF